MKRRRLLKIGGILLGLLLVVGMLSVMFHRQILMTLAEWWIVEGEPPEAVDVIVVPGGGLDTRPFEAARLFHDGVSDTVIVFKSEVFPSQELGILPPHHELNLQVLDGLGVPEKSIRLLGSGVTSTADEVDALKQWMVDSELDSAVILTEIFPSRRTSWAYRKAFRNTGIEIEVVGIAPVRYNATNWWLNEEGVIQFQNEVIKYLYYRLRY